LVSAAAEISTGVKKLAGRETVADKQEPDRDELQAQIQELPAITDRLSINEFIQPGVTDFIHSQFIYKEQDVSPTPPC